MSNIGVNINQTGGANGITRGLYVNPTLTAAADWRSIEWSNNSGWGLYGAGTANNYLAGKLVIGTTTVSTFALDVNGTARVSGYALFGSGNSGTPLATLADFRGGSDVDFIQIARVSTSSDRYVRMYANGQIDALSTKTDSAPFTFAAAANANTSGVRGLFTLTNTFNPTSGTATYTTFAITQTINQTGGANGITRGLYVNPTLTAAADFRAIETSAGNVLFGSNFFWDNTNGSLGVGTNAIYAPSTFSLDVNGGLLVKNTSGRTAQITLINANPALGGNEGFIVHSVGGTSTSSFAQLQGYYGLSVTGSTALRLNPLGGAVIVNSTTNSGEQFQVTGDARITGTIYQDSAADALFNFQNAGANKWRIGNAFVSGSNYFQLYDSVSNLERIRWNNNSTATFTSDITFIGGSNAVATFQSTQPDVKIQASGASNAVSLSLVPSNGFEGVIQNNVTNGFIQVKTASTTRVTFKNGGQVNFQPLAADPAGAGAGDVYYNSGTNKLRLYDGTSWVDLN
jgi:hypothetical protein